MNKFNLAWLSLTYQCNSKCLWCYAGSSDYHIAKEKSLDPKRHDGILDLVKNLGIPRVTLIGGEPTVYPELESIIAKSEYRGIKTIIVTNGRKFKDRDFTHKLKQAGLKHAAFSIEGPREIHNQTTQIPNSFDEAMSGLENVLLEGMDVATNTVISALNHEHLNKTVDSLKSFNLKYLGFNISGPCIRGDNKYLLSPKKAVEAFERVYEYAKSLGVKTKLSTPVPVCNFSSQKIRSLVNDGTIWGGPCQIVHGSNFVFDYNGDVIPCTHLTGFPLFNIFEEDKVIGKNEFIDKYNSEFVKLFREKVSRYASTKCDNCSEKCSGGCPLLWTKFDPDKEIKGISSK